MRTFLWVLALKVMLINTGNIVSRSDEYLKVFTPSWFASLQPHYQWLSSPVLAQPVDSGPAIISNLYN